MTKLINKKTGNAVELGDTVETFRGERGMLVRAIEPHKQSSTGRIAVEFANGSTREFYPGVCDLTFERRESDMGITFEGGAFKARMADEVKDDLRNRWKRRIEERNVAMTQCLELIVLGDDKTFTLGKTRDGYATWAVSRDNSSHWGHYFSGADAAERAMQDLYERAGLKLGALARDA